MESIKKFLLSNEEYKEKDILITIFRDKFLLEKNIFKNNNELFINQILKILKNKTLSKPEFKNINFHKENKSNEQFDYIFFIFYEKKISNKDIKKIINKFKINFKTGSKLFIFKSNKENIIDYKLKIFNKNNKSQNLFLSKEFLLYDYLYCDYIPTLTISKNRIMSIFFNIIIYIIKSLVGLGRLKFIANKAIVKYIFLPKK